MSKLAATMLARLEVIRAEPRRPEGFDFFGHNRVLEVLPDTLRVGVDRLVVLRTSPRVAGVYMGIARRGLVAILPDGEKLCIMVDPFMVKEERPLPSSLDFEEFKWGYYQGHEAADEQFPFSDRTNNRVPDAFSRGFALGYQHQRDGKYRWWPENAYNECVRRLANEFPDEHWVGAPLGPRELRGEEEWRS